MNGFLKVEHSKRQLVMSREFAKYANDTIDCISTFGEKS